MSDERQAPNAPRYSMRIAWSEKDGAYLVTLPEWMPRLINSIAVTHGATYEQAAKNGREALEMLIEQAQAAGEPLPKPQLIEYADEDTEVASA